MFSLVKFDLATVKMKFNANTESMENQKNQDIEIHSRKVII
jgi:hypothetical protein